MKKLLLATVALSALAISAPSFAADLRAPVLKAPPPAAAPAPWSWTGCYVGGHVGGTWGTKEAFDPFDGSPLGSGTVNGFLGGGQVGCNYQVNWVVFGVEGDFSWTNASGSGIGNFSGKSGGIANIDWYATATARIGGTIDHALLYLKGGAAWVRDRYSSGSGCIGFAELSDGDLDGCETFSATETRTGWTVGAGVEYAFTRNWSGKIEYDYMDFGTRTLRFTDPGGDEFTDLSIRQRVHTVKAGVNYKFDWGGPIAARY